MGDTKLVRMANQIATAFRHMKDEEAAAATADHIKAYWNPLMRREIYSHIAAGGEGLEPLALQALSTLRRFDPAGSATAAG